MYYRIHKSRLLTAHQDDSDWRVVLDEGYLTERHSTPEAALDDAIRWLECQAVSLKERLAQGVPDLTVNLHIYPTEAGGRSRPIGLGWGCPCVKDDLQEGWDGYPLLESEMTPGERRRLGFVFLSGAAAVSALRPSGRFFLWEGRFIGEAEVIP